MSYGITSIGEKADVVAEVNANQYVPQYIKDVVAAAIGKIPEPVTSAPAWPACECVRVVANGHDGGGHTISIEPFNKARKPTA